MIQVQRSRGGKDTYGAWYTPEMYDRDIDTTRVARWRKNLSRTAVLVIEDALGKHELECLERYDMATPTDNRALVSTAYALEWLAAKTKSASRRVRDILSSSMVI